MVKVFYISLLLNANVNHIYHYLQKHLWIGRIARQLKEEVLAADEMMLSLYRHTWGEKFCKWDYLWS